MREAQVTSRRNHGRTLNRVCTAQSVANKFLPQIATASRSWHDLCTSRRSLLSSTWPQFNFVGMRDEIWWNTNDKSNCKAFVEETSCKYSCDHESPKCTIDVVVHSVGMTQRVLQVNLHSEC